MKKFLSKIFKNGVVGTIIVIALGLLLTFFPGFVADTICYIFGGLSLAAAGFYLYKCIKKEGTVINAFSALAYLALGIILIVFKSKVYAAIPLTAGICMLVFSLLKLFAALSFRKINNELFKKLLIPCIINAVLGIALILIGKFVASEVITTRIIGVILLYCACEGIVTKLLIRADGKGASPSSEKQIVAKFSEPDEDENSSNNEASSLKEDKESKTEIEDTKFDESEGNQ